MHTDMEFRMRDRVCYECADLHPVPLKGKCHIFCSRKATQSRICKNHRPLWSAKIPHLFNKNKLKSKYLNDPWFFFFFFFFLCVCFLLLLLFFCLFVFFVLFCFFFFLFCFFFCCCCCFVLFCFCFLFIYLFIVKTVPYCHLYQNLYLAESRPNETRQNTSHFLMQSRLY